VVFEAEVGEGEVLVEAHKFPCFPLQIPYPGTDVSWKLHVMFKRFENKIVGDRAEVTPGSIVQYRRVQ